MVGAAWGTTCAKAGDMNCILEDAIAKAENSRN